MTAFHQKIAARAWGSLAPERLLNTLCHDIGPRPPGSEGFRAAQSLLSEELRNIGASVSSEPVDMLSWEAGRATLTLEAQPGSAYGCIQLAHSAAADVSGPLIRLSDVSPGALDRVGTALCGSIVLKDASLVSGATFTPLVLDLERLAERHVAGVITAGSYVPGQAEIDLACVDRLLPIPAVGVSPENGRALAGIISPGGGPSVRIYTEGASRRVTCANLIADFPPRNAGDGVVILGAHLDTFHHNPGALDNLTGVVTAIEIARVLAPLQHRFQRTLRVIIYTGEEYGFCGSKAYVKTHAGDLGRLRFVYNLDTLWGATAHGIAVMECPSMRTYIDEIVCEGQRNVDVRNLFCMSSDYLPFLLEGIPAARPADFEASMPPWSHTILDVLENISPDWIRLNAMVHARVIGAMLCDPAPLPVERRTPDEIYETVCRLGASDAMRAYRFDRYI